MRSLLAAALAVAAGIVHQAAGGPRIETLYSRAGSIAAFAQDGPLVVWFAPGGSGCNTLQVASLENPLHVTLPQQGKAQNVTCRWHWSTPTRLAIAGNRVAWTLRQESPIPFDYLLGASTTSPKERRFQEFAHSKNGVGLWLADVSGDGATLAYGLASVDYVDEAGCLSGIGTCALKTTGGGVYRMVGRKTPTLVPGTDTAGAVMVSVSHNAVAYVPSGGVAKDGRPVAGDQPIVVVDATSGNPISRPTPDGTPLAISLAPSLLATLERTPAGTRLAWYDRATGTPQGSVPVPDSTSPELAADDREVVYRVGRSIRAVDIGTAKSQVLTRAAATPIGLSVEGRRVAWAENLKGSARIRALYLTR